MKQKPVEDNKEDEKVAESADTDVDNHVYFGYGSNLSLQNLKYKTIEYISYSTGILHGYKLNFGMYVGGIMDPAFASIHKSDQDTVHGCLLYLNDTNWTKLKNYEGVYDLLEVEIEIYSNRNNINGSYIKNDKNYIKAFTFIYNEQTMDKLQKLKDKGEIKRRINVYKQDAKPGKNYLNTLIRGATDLKLDEKYIDFLKNVDHIEYPDHNNLKFDEGTDEYKKMNAKVFSMDEIVNSENNDEGPYTVLKGIVFSMKHAITSLKNRDKCKDATLIFAKRWAFANEENTSCIEKLEDDQKEYLNAMLYSAILYKSDTAWYKCVGILSEKEKYGYKNYEW